MRQRRAGYLPVLAQYYRQRFGSGTFGGTRQRVNMRQRAARSFTMNRQRRKVKSGGGITTQHDKKFVYAKRSMPLRKKRRWRRFVKKINFIAEKELGTRTVVMNKAYNLFNTTSTNQLVGSCYLYSQNGSTSEVAGDLNIIAGLENTGNPTAAAGITVNGTTKLMFQSGILDITVRNASTYTDTGGILKAASEAKMELDVYECIVRRVTEETGTTYTQFSQLLADNNTDITPIGGSGTELVYTMRGSTPFDQTNSLSRWGIKILKKTKYFLPNGDTMTYQIRDPKRRVGTIDDLKNQDGFNRPGWTRVVYFVGKLVTGLAVGTAVGTYQETLTIGATRKYMYKLEGANDDRASYITT